MSTDLVTTDSTASGGLVTNQQLPAHLRSGEYKKEGREDGFGSYFVPPVLKVVQGQSKSEIRQQYKVGSVIVLPMGAMVAPALSDTSGPPFTFIPLLRFTEFACFNPYVPDKLTTIRLDAQGNPMRTMDARSDIARRARDFKGKTNVFPCPEVQGKECKYREVLNFISIVETPDLASMPVLIRFSGGGFRDGKLLWNLIEFRNDANIYDCRFQATVGPRKSGGFDYLGLTVENPKVEPWYVQEHELHLQYRALHLRLAEEFKAGQIQANYDDISDEVMDAESRVVSEEDAGERDF